MVTNAFPIKLRGDVWTARHKPGRFLDGSDFASSVLNVVGHEESAHVSLGDTDCRLLEDLLDALQVPRPCRPWVSVEKMPALFKPIPVQ